MVKVDTRSADMANISFTLPTAALEQISAWADTSGLPRAKFYSTALNLGARMMTSSAGSGFADALTPEERKYVSESANASVTPEVLLHIVLGEGAPAGADDPEQATSELVVSLAGEVCQQSDAAADSLGMVREKFYALAFVMGARLAASALDPGSIFPLELLVQSTEGSVTPDMVMRAAMRRHARAEPKQTLDGNKL
jgi:hypothetical protein